MQLISYEIRRTNNEGSVFQVLEGVVYYVDPTTSSNAINAFVADWQQRACTSVFLYRERTAPCSTGSPSSNYEHRRVSALLRTIQNIEICMGKKTIVSVTYENERISIKNSLPYLKCVLRVSFVVHGAIYDLFMISWVFM